MKYVVFCSLIIWMACTAVPVKHELIIQGVSVVDVTTETVQPNRSVAIDGDSISAIYESKVRARARTNIIDGSGKFMGKSDQFGAVQKGYKASLVLLSSNPLENIANTRAITDVIVHGKHLSRSDLDQMLLDVREMVSSTPSPF
jgi:imidazolonepropionase-like amidohydrolase